MIRHGAEPFLECSSRGDKRFSAFYARIHQLGNRTIEELYQAYKKFEDGTTGLSPKEAKGRKPINLDDCLRYYSQLWDMYIFENPSLANTLVAYEGLSDIFGQDGHVCQATELWRIRNNHLTSLDKRLMLGLTYVD